MSNADMPAPRVSASRSPARWSLRPAGVLVSSASAMRSTLSAVAVAHPPTGAGSGKSAVPAYTTTWNRTDGGWARSVAMSAARARSNFPHSPMLPDASST